MSVGDVTTPTDTPQAEFYEDDGFDDYNDEDNFTENLGDDGQRA